MLRYKVDFGVIADALEGADDEFYDSDDDFSTFAVQRAAVLLLICHSTV